MLVTLLQLLNVVDLNVDSLNVSLCLKVVSHSWWVRNPSLRRILSEHQTEWHLSLSSRPVKGDILGVFSLQFIIMFEQPGQCLCQPWKMVIVKNWFVVVI